MMNNSSSSAIKKSMTETLDTIRDLESKIQNYYNFVRSLSKSLPAELDEIFTVEAERINKLFTLIPQALREPWDSAYWQSNDIPSGPEFLEYFLYGIQQLDNSGSREKNKPIYLPYLRSEGAIIILTDNASLERSRDIMRNLVLRTAVLMPGESSFTLFDPKGLGATFPFETRLPRIRRQGNTISETLSHITQDIQRINQRVIGGAGKFLDLNQETRSGESFEIISVVDFPTAYEREPRALELLTRIGSSGPRAGRHLIVEYNTSCELPRGFDMKSFENATVIDCRKNIDLRVPTFASQSVIEHLLANAENSSRSNKNNHFNVVAEDETMMSESSAERIETMVGERLNILFGKDHSSGEVSHGVIAGQVGSGKSHLLHVIISGLASRYSPKELKLYLLDAKHGVEFKAYKDLPHAEVVSLRTRPAIARKVLEDFHAEMQSRYALFKDKDVNNLSAYRSLTGTVMPRMLLIIDEYQLIFEGADSNEGMNELAPILHKGRAAGMHVLLCAQRFDVEGMNRNSFNEIHLRASLSLAQDYILKVSAFGREGRKLISELAPSGELVLNAKSGRDGDNHRGSVSRLARQNDNQGAGDKGRTLEQVVKEIISFAGPDAPRPIMLDGTTATTLADNSFVMNHRFAPPVEEELQRIACLPLRAGGFGERNWSSQAKMMGLWLGRNFDVRSHALCTLRRGRDQNLMLVGSRSELRSAMIANMLLALPSTVDPAEIDITVIDAMDDYLPGAGLVQNAAEYLKNLGAKVSVFTAADGEQGLRDYADPDHTRQGLLIICDPDRLTALVESYDQYDRSENGLWAIWSDLLKRGSERARHMIISTDSVSVLKRFMKINQEGKYFTHRIMQQMSPDDSLSLLETLEASKIEQKTEHPLASLYVDMTRFGQSNNMFSNYAFDHKINSDMNVEALQMFLDNTFTRAPNRVDE